MDTPPADSPAPERPIPWWRHRRRLFYLAVVIVPVATLWGGWVWWYRADFPIPSETQCRALGISEALYHEWYDGPYYGKLLHWKIARETRRLRLSGTVWQDSESGITLTFGTDGQLSMVGPPGWEEQVKMQSGLSGPSKLWAWEAGLSALHLTPYQFHPHMPLWQTSGDPPNLSLPNSPWDGFLEAGSHSVIVIGLRPNTWKEERPHFFFHLTRVPAAP